MTQGSTDSTEYIEITPDPQVRAVILAAAGLPDLTDEGTVSGGWLTDTYRGYLLAQVPGWRTTWVIAPEEDAQPVTRPDAEQARDYVDEREAW